MRKYWIRFDTDKKFLLKKSFSHKSFKNCFLVLQQFILIYYINALPKLYVGKALKIQ